MIRALRDWVKQADIDVGRGRPGELTTEEREELRRLRRENQILRQEREILKKPRPFSPRRRREAAVATALLRACYALADAVSSLNNCCSIRQLKATKCNPATVSGNRS